jgi:hypothetical protein
MMYCMCLIIGLCFVAEMAAAARVELGDDMQVRQLDHVHIH